MNLNTLPNYVMVTPPGTLPKEKSNLKQWFDKSISASDALAMMRVKVFKIDALPDPTREPKYILQSLAGITRVQLIIDRCFDGMNGMDRCCSRT